MFDETKLLSLIFRSDHCSRSRLRRTSWARTVLDPFAIQENNSCLQRQPTHKRHQRLLKAVVAMSTTSSLTLPREEHGCNHGYGGHGCDCTQSWPANRLRNIAKRSTLQATDIICHIMFMSRIYINVTHKCSFTQSENDTLWSYKISQVDLTHLPFSKCVLILPISPSQSFWPTIPFL